MEDSSEGWQAAIVRHHAHEAQPEDNRGAVDPLGRGMMTTLPWAGAGLDYLTRAPIPVTTNETTR